MKFRTAFAAVVALSCMAVAGCEKHDVAAVQMCERADAKQSVVVTSRGASAMAKIGLTPDELEALTDCD